MSEQMKGFTCCGDCIHYNYKKHKCNLGASVVTDARSPFYDDCPIPDIPSEQEIRNKAIDCVVNKVLEQLTALEIEDSYATVTECKMILKDVSEQMKEVGE